MNRQKNQAEKFNCVQKPGAGRRFAPVSGFFQEYGETGTFILNVSPILPFSINVNVLDGPRILRCPLLCAQKSFQVLNFSPTKH